MERFDRDFSSHILCVQTGWSTSLQMQILQSYLNNSASSQLKSGAVMSENKS